MATTRPRPHLTIADVLAMTEEDLRIECLRLEIPASGLDKSAIQRQLSETAVTKVFKLNDLLLAANVGHNVSIMFA